MGSPPRLGDPGDIRSGEDPRPPRAAGSIVMDGSWWGLAAGDGLVICCVVTDDFPAAQRGDAAPGRSNDATAEVVPDPAGDLVVAGAPLGGSTGGISRPPDPAAVVRPRDVSMGAVMSTTDPANEGS